MGTGVSVVIDDASIIEVERNDASINNPFLF